MAIACQSLFAGEIAEPGLPARVAARPCARIKTPDDQLCGSPPHIPMLLGRQILGLRGGAALCRRSDYSQMRLFVGCLPRLASGEDLHALHDLRGNTYFRSWAQSKLR